MIITIWRSGHGSGAANAGMLSPAQNISARHGASVPVRRSSTRCGPGDGGEPIAPTWSRATRPSRRTNSREGSILGGLTR